MSVLQAFTFETDVLDYMTLEDEICSHYGISSCQSSDLPPVISTERYYEFCISGINKGISGKLYAFRSGNSYTVDVSRTEYFNTD